MLHFDGNMFFYVILPPIVFSSGYNMHRKRFFENISYICFFGILGTLATYTAFVTLTYLVVSNWEMKKYNGATGETEDLKL
jgi:NhaP-type Na+/H+ or K+/H+ antiporter